MWLLQVELGDAFESLDHGVFWPILVWRVGTRAAVAMCCAIGQAPLLAAPFARRHCRMRRGASPRQGLASRRSRRSSRDSCPVCARLEEAEAEAMELRRLATWREPIALECGPLAPLGRWRSRGAAHERSIVLVFSVAAFHALGVCREGVATREQEGRTRTMQSVA